MVNRILTYGGSLGFLLILLFGRSVVSYVTSHDERGLQADVFKIEIARGKSAIRDLTFEIRKRLVAISRHQIEGEQKTPIASETSAPGLQELKSDLENLLLARDQLAELVAHLETIQISGDELKTDSAFLVHARDLIERLSSGTATEAHFMDEVMPVVAKHEAEIERRDPRFTNHFANSDVENLHSSGAAEAALTLDNNNPIEVVSRSTN